MSLYSNSCADKKFGQNLLSPRKRSVFEPGERSKTLLVFGFLIPRLLERSTPSGPSLAPWQAWTNARSPPSEAPLSDAHGAPTRGAREPWS
jgi:hypothetical protein